MSRCVRCQQIDPAPVSWEHGDLSVMENWTRQSADVTRYGRRCYLSVVDCGPSRFAVCRCIPNEQIDAIRTELEQLFRERGPPVELLMNNNTVFRSSSMRTLLDKWGVMPLYRAAYKPSGNGIVEREPPDNQADGGPLQFGSFGYVFLVRVSKVWNAGGLCASKTSP